MAQQQQELTEQDYDDFFDRLAKFGETLPEKEQGDLAAMVLVGLGKDLPVASEGSEAQADASEGEMEDLVSKLATFHDSLPGEEHRILDNIVQCSAGDVEGHTLIWSKEVPTNTVDRAMDYWRPVCTRSGGVLSAHRLTVYSQWSRLLKCTK